jgi:hypothetical protein
VSDMRKIISDALYRIGKEADGTILDLTLTAQRTPVVNALLSAIGDVPEPVQGPFVLTRTEEHALDIARRVLQLQPQGTVDVGRAVLVDLLGTIDRACKTLAAEPVPGPFTLNASETAAVSTLGCNRPPNESERRVLLGALQRACKTLAYPAPMPEAESLRELHYLVDELEGEQDAGVIWNKVNDRVGKLLQRTLAAPAVAGGEWTEADYKAAREAHQLARRGSFSDGVEAALDAVKHRLATPVIEPPDETICDVCAAEDGTVLTLCSACAKRTAIEPLTDEERFELEDCRHMHKCGVAVADGKLDALLRITERRFHKPATKRRALGEILFDHFCPGIRCTPSDLAHYEAAAAAVIAAHEASK